MNMDTRIGRECLHLLPVLAAIGCSDPSLLGIGAAEIDEELAGSAKLTNLPEQHVKAARSSSVISGRDGESLWMRRPSLGDIDGDGLDDFIVETSWQEPSSAYGNRAVLFYGRAEFPAQLSTADADAVVDSGELSGTGLGDINGDGLADFALGDWAGTEIIFGSATRLAGQHERYSRGLAWYPAIAGDSLLYVRPLGDVDGDGSAELRVTVVSAVPEDEVAYRPSELITDYLMAGRQDDWPSGNWDPSWAVAMLGDEPPAYEDNGATTVLQRLTVLGTGDLDGDGYTDVIALGRWRAWVFYGSAQGFHGTLMPAQADASLTWPHDPTARRGEFAKTIPFILGDVDGDGTADIGVPKQAELGIVYGTKRRWSGRVELQPELTIVRSVTEPSNQHWWMALSEDTSYGFPWPELVAAQIRVGVADLDGDGRRELVLHENRFPAVREYDDQIDSVMYALTGPSQHATGRYVLSDVDIYRPEGVSETSAALSRGVLLDPGGDFDGDGSTDLIFGVVQDAKALDSRVSLHLLPGTPRVPD